MGLIEEEEREKLFTKISKINQKITILMSKKSKIDEEIYKLTKKREKVVKKHERRLRGIEDKLLQDRLEGLLGSLAQLLALKLEMMVGSI